MEFEQLGRMLARVSPVGIFRTDTEGNCLYVNDRWLEISGLTLEQARGRGWSKAIHPEDREWVNQLWYTSAAQKLPFKAEYRFLNPAGIVTWVSGQAAVETDDSGRVIGYLGTITDITDRVESSERKYRALFQSLPEMVTLIQPDGTVVDVNQAVSRIIGLDREQVIGRKVSALKLLDRSQTAQLRTLAARVAEGETSSPFEIEMKTAGGEKKWLEISVSLLPLPEASPLIQVITRDLTGKKLAEQERERMMEEMIRAQKLESLGTLAGGIARDFNNILMAILGNISLIRLRPDLDEELKEILTDLEKGSYRARDLAQQLLTFARGGSPQKRPVDLDYLVRRAAEFAMRGSRARGSFAISTRLPVLELDETQISQAINNIVINATQAMPEGGPIDIRVEPIRLTKKLAAPLGLRTGDYVRIAIADQGPGIPPETLTRIFDPYFTTRENASGIGLTTAYAIVKKHDGHLGVSSTPGAGATLEIHLPVTGDAVRSAEPRLAPKKGSGRVLVMDDEESVRQIVGKMMKRLGYKADFAAEGTEAVRLFQRAMIAGKPYQAVILDLTIPGGMGGKETVALLREIDPGLQAIVSSGYSEDPILSSHADYGFVGRLSKPYRIEDIADELHRLLSPSK